jgi:hypothetical protein
MITITDFINVLLQYYHNNKMDESKVEELEGHKISTWRGVSRRMSLGSASMHRSLAHHCGQCSSWYHLSKGAKPTLCSPSRTIRIAPIAQQVAEHRAGGQPAEGSDVIIE